MYEPVMWFFFKVPIHAILYVEIGEKKYLIHSPLKPKWCDGRMTPTSPTSSSAVFSIVAGDAKPIAQLQLTIFLFNTRQSWQQPLYLSLRCDTWRHRLSKYWRIFLLTSPLNFYLICVSQWLLCLNFAWWAIKVTIFLIISKKTFTTVIFLGLFKAAGFSNLIPIGAK